MMDEDTFTAPGSTTDPEPGSSGNTTIKKLKKKATTTKKKADKEVAPAKKGKKETAPEKKADKVAAPPKKAKGAEPAKKTDKGATHALPPTEKKKTTLDLVCEAIEVLGESRKGLSVQAIKKYVRGKQESEAPGFNTHVNKALIKGIEKGLLVRPAISKDATGAVGFFRLAKAEPTKRKIKEPRKKLDSGHASDSEVTEKPVKPRKRNLSDTYIEEMMRSSTPKPSLKETAASKDTKQAKKLPKKNANDKKDTSDSKIVVKKTKRKSMKSYSSDTEVDFEKSKIAKTAKMTKKAETDKPKADDSSKASKAKVKKLYNSKDEKGTKSGKTKAQKQA